MISTFVLFISLCALLSVLLAMVVIMPWLRSDQHLANLDNRLEAVNVAVFRERLQELDSDQQAGRISSEHFHSQKLELQRQLLDAQQQTHATSMPGKKSRLIVLVWIPLLSAMAYLLAADRTAVFKLWQAQDSVGQVADDLLTARIDSPPEWAIRDTTALISAMQTNVHHHAHDPNRWMRLSELFISLEATESALEALARAYRLAPEDDAIAATYAQISFFANGGRLDANSRRILQQLLQRQPKHEGAQMLMAMGESRAGNYAEAQRWLDILKASIEAKPGDHSQALASLAELADNIDAQASKAAAGVQVTVTVNASLLPLIQADDVLFVSIADVAGGAPFAATRVPASQLQQGQLTLTLSDLNAMMPERTLQIAREQQVQLALSARISHSGDALSQSGDLSANPVPLGVDQTQSSIEINQQIP